MNETTIIPMPLFDKLMEIRDKVTKSAWEIGDLTLGIVEYNKLNLTHASKTEIYKAVASVIGKESRTVRMYAHVSETFDDPTRTAFDVLSYDHFLISAGCEDPKAALQWAVERVSETGKPGTVDEMRRRFGRGRPEEVTPNIDALLVLPGKIRDTLASLATLFDKDLYTEAVGITHELDDCLHEISDDIETKSMMETAQMGDEYPAPVIEGTVTIPESPAEVAE